MWEPWSTTKGVKRASGFTLIEVLTVVLIVGVLLAVAIPLYQKAYRTSAVSVVKTNMRTIAAAAHAYYLRTGRYPSDFANTNKDGTGVPTAFIGPGLDLEYLPFGPTQVWYSWRFYGTNGSPNPTFHVTAHEDGENVWNNTANAANNAYFDLGNNRFYLQNGAPF